MNKRKLVYLLLSIVLAFGMWLYVVTVVSPESEDTFYDIPVVLKNKELLQDKGLMLIMEETPTVTLKLTGNRTDLVRLNNSNITVMVDLSRIYEPGVHELDYDVSFPADTGSGAISLQTKTPQAIKLTVERKIVDKAVDVVIRESGNVPADCIIQERSLSTEQILVTGPKSVVDKISQACIDVDIEGRDKTFTQTHRFTLCDDKGRPVDAQLVETDVGSVDLAVVIQKIREVKLEVDVIYGGGATEQASKVTVEPGSIKVVGNEEDLAGLDRLVLDTIHLADYDKDTTLEYVIKLPSGVKDLGNNETAVVTIQFPELDITELTVTQFEALNVPAGMKAEILAQALSVRIRGAKTQVNQLKADDVKIVVDCKDKKAGNFNVTAQVVITNPAYSSAGALGTYQVTVSLTDKKK